jgi:hypothetical protein
VTEWDPRLQTWAYITDGVELYEVVGVHRGPGMMGMQTVRVVVENCRSLRGLEYLPDRIRSTFDLVRRPPRASCPDCPDEIDW